MIVEHASRNARARVPERLRLVLAYLLAIAGLDAVLHLVWDPEQTGTLVGALGTLLTRGLTIGVLLALLLTPAAVLSLHLAARVLAVSRITGAVIGAAAWTAWYLFVAGIVLLARTIGLWPEGFLGVLALIAGAGGSFGALGLGERVRPSRAVSILGVVVGCLVIAGCFVTAGWWGSTAPASIR